MIKAIIGFIIGILIGFILFAITPLGNRYYFMKVGDDAAVSLYRVDTWTGQAWYCVADADNKLNGCAEITKNNYEINY